MPSQEYIKLSELTAIIESVIESNFREKVYFVAGETIEIRNKPEYRQCYLKLIEKEESTGNITSEINASIWGTSYNIIKAFERETGESFKENIQILVKVKVVYHRKYGLKLDIIGIDSSFTIGNLELARRKTLQKLLAENIDKVKLVDGEYITYNKTLQLKLVIQNIALISSHGTDGHNDFIKQLVNNQRLYKFNINYFNTQVQGINAEVSIQTKLMEIYNSKYDYDAVVIVRGGGSQVDFSVFDNYELCRMVARYPIPIITGIGHERNEAIIDMMAKKKTNAPTHAATFILHNNREFEEKIIGFQKSVIIKSQQSFHNNSQRLYNLKASLINYSKKSINSHKEELVKINQITTNTSKSIIYSQKSELTRINQVTINKSKTIIYTQKSALISLTNQLISKPQILTSDKLKDLDNITSNLKSFLKKLFVSYLGYVRHYDSLCKMANPDGILNRGFAIVYYKGNILKSSDEVSIGSEINVRFSQSEISSTVKSKNKIDGNKPLL